jgi:hypothetical protein
LDVFTEFVEKGIGKFRVKRHGLKTILGELARKVQNGRGVIGLLI